MLTRLTPADYRRVRWKNGLGWTTELALHPAPVDGIPVEFDWRVSVAEVDADCEFSCFPGIDRSLAVLGGEGMELRVGHGPPVALRVGDPALAFSGDLPAHARLLAGPTRDFNVMTRRERFTHALTRRSLDGSLALERPSHSAWLIYVQRGQVEVAGAGLVATDECLIAAPGPSDEALTLDAALELRGAAELMVVRLRALAR